MVSLLFAKAAGCSPPTWLGSAAKSFAGVMSVQDNVSTLPRMYTGAGF